jgi:hypothetical protein
MVIKGVCYDVGRAYGGRFLTRPVFDPVTTRRELQIIRDDLHANEDVSPSAAITDRTHSRLARKTRAVVVRLGRAGS